ncbi:MAG: SDR family oxidoreductase [Paracoccaceae bacterium]
MGEQPVCIITGGSGIIGSGIARVLSAQGYRLVLMSRSGCGALAEELGQVGFAGSVLEDADVEAAVQLAVERFGRLDRAVFVGGRQSESLKGFDIKEPPAPGPDGLMYDADYDRDMFDIPFEAWHLNYDMQVLGPMRLFRAALPHFRVGGGGSFVAISGIEALQPRLVYPMGPNRAALHGFVKLLSDRHGREGIRLNLVVPGLIENGAAGFPDGWVERVPMGRHGRIEEIGATVGFLLSEGGGYITGQAIVADGGVNRSAGM